MGTHAPTVYALACINGFFSGAMIRRMDWFLRKPLLGTGCGLLLFKWSWWEMIFTYFGVKYRRNREPEGQVSLFVNWKLLFGNYQQYNLTFTRILARCLCVLINQLFRSLVSCHSKLLIIFKRTTLQNNISFSQGSILRCVQVFYNIIIIFFLNFFYGKFQRLFIT